MLDTIKNKGEPRSREYFLVFEENLQEFIGTEGDYHHHKLMVVAVANYGPDGKLFDWAAYTGLTPFPYNNADVMETIARHGDKLTVGECKFYMRAHPGLASLLKRYRE